MRRLALLVIVAIPLAWGTTSAAALGYPPTGAAITLSPSSGPAGSRVTVTGSGCHAGAALTVTFGRTVLRTTHADPNGGFKLHVTIPARARAGSHTISVEGAGCHQPAATFTVTSGAPLTYTATRRAPLAFTGANVGPLSATAAGMAVVGAVLVLASRRRREARHSLTGRGSSVKPVGP